MKNKQLRGWVIVLVFFAIFIIYAWGLLSTYWTHSLVRLPMDILMVLASLIGIFVYFPRKDKDKTNRKG